MHRPTEGIFEKGSPVLEYWLANSEGFMLSHRPVKRRVKGVVIDPATGQAHSLVVGRSSVVSADAVTAVDVRKRTLYLSRRRRERTPRDHARLAAARRQAIVAGSATARVTGTGARKSASVASKWTRRAAAFTAYWARTAATAADVRLRPLATAYAHNAATIARAYAQAARARGRRPSP